MLVIVLPTQINMLHLYCDNHFELLQKIFQLQY